MRASARLAGANTRQDGLPDGGSELTVEKLNPAVYTCAEWMYRLHASHLKMGHVNDYVVSGEYGTHTLAQAAMNRGLMGVSSELLTYRRGNELYRKALPSEWFGKRFHDLFVQLKQTHNAILVAVHLASDAEKLADDQKASIYISEWLANPAHEADLDGDWNGNRSGYAEAFAGFTAKYPYRDATQYHRPRADVSWQQLLLMPSSPSSIDLPYTLCNA